MKFQSILTKVRSFLDKGRGNLTDDEKEKPRVCDWVHEMNRLNNKFNYLTQIANGLRREGISNPDIISKFNNLNNNMDKLSQKANNLFTSIPDWRNACRDCPRDGCHVFSERKGGRKRKFRKKRKTRRKRRRKTKRRRVKKRKSRRRRKRR